MSLIIWKPAQYAREFSKETGLNSDTAYPSNGALADAPYDRDTVVREVARFTGWKKECFCDTGEFEVKTTGVKPEDVKRGNMVWLDGSVFVIEAVSWELTENGYECTISGRDFWRYPDSEIHDRYVGEPYRNWFGGDNEADETNAYNGECLVIDMGEFMRDEWRFMAGWFRDRRRYPQAWDGVDKWFYPDLIVKHPDGFTTRKTDSEPTVSEIMSYGAEWRMIANWFGVGIRYRFAFDEDAGVFTIQPEIYEGADSNIEISADARGVSGFKYSEDGRNAVNAILATWTSEKRTFDESGSHKYKGNAFTETTYDDESAADTVNYFYYVAPDDHRSYAERLALYSEKHLDAGSAPTESDETKEKMMAWLRSGIESEVVKPEQAFEFEYDNSGAYKYGVHFNVGDFLTVRADYLNVAAKQRLVTVTTKYEAGAAKSYEFEFGEQTIKNAYMSALKRKMSEIDRRTATARKVIE